jgi:hypothetical protein
VKRTLTASILAFALAGCGGVKAGDLFVVYRSGTSPHASLSLLVNEEGNVNCNGGPILKLTDAELVEARTIQEETHDAAAEDKVLAPRAGSVLRYHLREEAGTVTFSDNSPGQPAILHRLQLFVLEVAQQVCRLPE